MKTKGKEGGHGKSQAHLDVILLLPWWFMCGHLIREGGQELSRGDPWPWHTLNQETQEVQKTDTNSDARITRTWRISGQLFGKRVPYSSSRTLWSLLLSEIRAIKRTWSTLSLLRLVTPSIAEETLGTKRALSWHWQRRLKITTSTSTSGSYVSIRMSWYVMIVSFENASRTHVFTVYCWLLSSTSQNAILPSAVR